MTFVQHPAAGLAVVVAITIGLSGCAAAPEEAGSRREASEIERTPSASPSHTPVASDAPDPTPAAEDPEPAPGPQPLPAPPPAPVPGDVVTAAEMERFWQSGGGSGPDLGWYLLPDGSYAITDPAQALPPVVLTDIQRRIDAIGVDENVSRAPGGLQWEQERALQFDVALAGKAMVTVRLRYMAVPYDDRLPGGYRWVASSVQDGWWMQWERERDVLVGNVDAWVSANTAPGSWIVVVGPGDAVSPSP